MQKNELTGHWKLKFDYKYLGSQHLTELCPDGKDLNAKIISFSQELVEGEDGRKDKCIVAKLKSLDGKDLLPMIVNKENFRNLETAFKSYNIEDFVGKTIAIFAKKGKWFGKQQTALRIRDFAPTIELKALQPDEIGKAAEYFNTHRNLDGYKKVRTITPEQEANILELAKTLSNE